MKILIAAANPLNTERLALDDEMRLISRKIESSPYAAELEFITSWATRPDDLLHQINHHQPDILHFSGHGSHWQLLLAGNAMRPMPVAADAILQLLQLEAASSLKIVLLNSCYSAGLASEIERLVGCAIGMVETWNDRKAALFAASFYRALGFGATIKEAVAQGRTSILLEGFERADDVRLFCNADIAQTQLIGPKQHRSQSQSVPSPQQTGHEAAPIPLLDESECSERLARLLDGTRSASLTYIDIDGLLGINTVYGEHVGDLVIAACSALIRQRCTSTTDACRLRGDQFVILERNAPVKTARSRSSNLVRSLRKHRWSRIAPDLHASATGAIAHWDGSEHATNLILRAVFGVKEAKRHQRATLTDAPLVLPSFYQDLTEDQRIQELYNNLSSDDRGPVFRW